MVLPPVTPSVTHRPPQKYIRKESTMYEIENNSSVLRIGKTGENQFRTITFDVTPWVTVYPGGEILGVYRRPDGQAYPVPIRRTGNTASWTVTETDLVIAGQGEIELRIVCGAIVGKSSRFICLVTEAIEPGENPPAPGMDWIAETIKNTAEAAQAAKDAREELLAAAERGDFDGPPGDLSGDEIAAMIGTYLKEHPLSIPPMSADVLGGAKLGENLSVSEDGYLSVDTADTAEENNTRPITSAAVHAIVGHIGSVLDSL